MIGILLLEIPMEGFQTSRHIIARWSTSKKVCFQSLSPALCFSWFEVGSGNPCINLPRTPFILVLTTPR